MKKKLIIPMLALAAACLGTSVTAEAAQTGEGEWMNNGDGWWFATDDEEKGYLWSGVYEIDGTCYYFNYDGFVDTGVHGYWDDSIGEYGEYVYRYFTENGAITFTGWHEVDGEWYYAEEDMDVYHGQWLVYEGNDYYFDWEGKMVTGRPVYNSYYDEAEDTYKSRYYVVGQDGTLQKGGWVSAYSSDSNEYAGQVDWYYVDGSGVAATGWLNDGEGWYYLSSDGRMMRNYWLYDDEKDTRYYFGADGKMVTGWYNRATSLSEGGDWLYFNADGTAYDGWLEGADGSWYYVFDGDVVHSSWVTQYEDSKGELQYGSGSSGNYSDPVVSYYFGRDGKMVKGWYDASSTNDLGEISKNYWIYTDPATGAEYDGWLNMSGSWYYISNGSMVTSGTCYTGDVDYDDYDYYDEYYEDYCADRAENTYVFNSTGQLVTGGWYKYNYSKGSTWYYAQPSGQAYNGWLNENGTWYYLNYGYLLVNQFTPDGYYVGADGAMVQ